MTQKAICPNCGAEGTVGRYCEFCGTKIPFPKEKPTTSGKQKEHKPRIVKFNITKDEAIESFFNSLYREGASFDNFKIINISTCSIPFIAYYVSYEYHWAGENEFGMPDNGSIKDKGIFILPSYDDRKQKLPSLSWITQKSDLYIKESLEGKYEINFDTDICKSEESPNEIWDRLGNKTISYIAQTAYTISHHSVISELQDNGVPITIPFYVVHFKFKGKEKDFFIDGLGYTYTFRMYTDVYSKKFRTPEERIAYYNSFENYLKQEEIGLTENQKKRLLKKNYPSSDFEALEKKKEEEIKTKSMEKSCLTIFLVVACFIIAVIGLIQYSNHAKQVELEEYNAEMAEKHVRDSIEHEKAMQQQKEERKKRNYRPSAPTPSFSDVEVIGLTNGVKQIRLAEEYENTIYGFDKQGFLISVKYTNYNTSVINGFYTIKQGKLITRDGKEVEYNKVSANEDIISCDNYTLCNVTYDSKNRIVKIKDEYDTRKFVYDEGNNAHKERDKYMGGTEAEEKMSIPIFDIIGHSIHIPQNWEDKITSSDEKGRPTEIVYDGTLSKETIKIAYW